MLKNLTIEAKPAWGLAGTTIFFATEKGLAPNSAFALLGALDQETNEIRRELFNAYLVRRGFQGLLGEVEIISHNELKLLGLSQYVYHDGLAVIVGYGKGVATEESLEEALRSALAALGNACATGMVPGFGSSIVASVVLEHQLGFYDFGDGIIDRLKPLRQGPALRAIARGLARGALELPASCELRFLVEGISPRSSADTFNTETVPTIVEQITRQAEAA